MLNEQNKSQHGNENNPLLCLRMQEEKRYSVAIMLAAGHKIISRKPEMVFAKNGRLFLYNDATHHLNEIKDEALRTNKTEKPYFDMVHFV